MRRLAHEEEADLVEHLAELRTRIFVCLVAVAAGLGVAYAFHRHLLDLLNTALPEQHRQPVTFGVAEPVLVSLKISFVAGFALALPIVLWQVWSYFAPAFQRHVQPTIATMVVAATGLFAVGIVRRNRRVGYDGDRARAAPDPVRGVDLARSARRAPPRRFRHH